MASNGHVQSMSELTESGIKHAEAHAREISQIKELDASKLTITQTTTPRKVPNLDSKEVWSFKECTDHQVMVTWTADEGWHAPEIKPYVSFDGNYFLFAFVFFVISVFLF